MITIALFSSNMFLSRIIQWAQGSKVSHSGICFEQDGKKYFLHAAWGGVQITPREQVLSNHIIVAEFEILPNLEDEVEWAVKEYVGRPYDTLGLLGYIPVLIARHLGLGIHNPLASKAGFVCSEFIIDCDVNHEITEFNGLDPETVTPGDLYDICSKGKSFRKL